MKLARGISLLLVLLISWFGSHSSSLVAQPYAFCVGNFNDYLSVIDMATNVEVANYRLTVSRGDRARGVAILPDRTKVYITIRDADEVRILNVDTTYTTLPTLSPTTISVGQEPYGACATPDNQYVYVNNGVDGTISVINTSTETVDTTFTVGSEPVGIGISPDGTRMVVANRTSSSVMVYELPSNARLATIPIVGEPYGVAMSKDNAFAYVANRGADEVDVIDLSTDTISATIAVGDYPTGVAVTPDGNKVLTTNANANTVSVINLSGGIPTRTDVSVGGSPWGVAVKPDGSQALIANRRPGNGYMSIIDLSTDAVVADIPDADLRARAPVGFGDFTGSTFWPSATPPAPFPVELIQFDAQPRGDAVYLSWQTATERNNDRFQIERSQDNQLWETVGEVAGWGNTQSVQSYQFTDHHAQPGQPYYYRLKQIDFDGQFSFSPRVSATIPLQGQTRLMVDAQAEQLRIIHPGASGELIDLSGRVLKAFSVHPGETRLRLSGWPKGLYLLRLVHPSGGVEMHKVLLK